MLRSYLAPGAAYYTASVSIAAAVSLDAGWRYALLAPAVVTGLAWLRSAVHSTLGRRPT
jgi:hypothetical protein